MSLILVVDDEPDLEALVVQKFRRRIATGEWSFLFAHDASKRSKPSRRTPASRWSWPTSTCRAWTG